MGVMRTNWRELYARRFVRMGIVWQRLGSLSPTLLLFRLAFERKHFRLASLEWILFHNLSSLLSAVRRNPVEMDKPKSESANLEFEWLRNIQIDRLQLTRFQVKIEKDISKQNKWQKKRKSKYPSAGTNSNLFSLRRQVRRLSCPLGLTRQSPTAVWCEVYT